MLKNPPPEHTKWKKGAPSPNPSGHPKGKPNRATIARKWLETGEKFKNPITGKEEQLSQEDIITLGQIKEARKGNTNAYKALMDSAHGMPKQEIDQNLHIGEKQSFKIGDQIITFE